MKYVRDSDVIKVRITPKERKRFEELRDRLEDDCKISIKQQSAIFMEAYFQYAENLLAAYIPNQHATQTKSQSQTAERKSAIHNLINEIKEKGFMFIGEAYANLLFQNTCFSDVKIRTKSSYFQQLMISDELVYLYLPYFYNTNRKDAIVLIHKKSKWYPQLKDLCFNIKEPLLRITHDNILETKFKDDLFKKIKNKAKYRSKLDQAEQTMLNAFLYEIEELKEKPMYDTENEDLIKIIKLRSEYRFEEAYEVVGHNPELYLSEKERLRIEAIENLNNMRLAR